ncbi:MAG: hypothetical protein F6J96_08600 [Symploca sp. SIO1C2]|nr:hypothetical protein [Symploca sp. SIO1C2]
MVLTHPPAKARGISCYLLLVVSCLSKNKKQKTNNQAAGGYPSHPLMNGLPAAFGERRDRS